MTEQTDQIRQLRDLNEHYLRTAIRFIQEAQADGVAEAGTYDSSGTSAAPVDGARIFDLSL